MEREKRQGRLQLLPLLQAERDRETLASERRLLQLEAQAHKTFEARETREAQKTHETPALDPPIYHNRKNYIPPAVGQ